MVHATTALAARSEVLALAQTIEDLALHEGTGSRAVEFHMLAGRLSERCWRVEHREADAKDALDRYRLASQDVALPGACDAAVRGAGLAGELASDPATTYAELYRVRRRAAAAGVDAAKGACGAPLDAALAALEAFRPAPSVLTAIDTGLASLGLLEARDAGNDRASRTTADADTPPRMMGIETWGGQSTARVVVHLNRASAFRVFDAAPTATDVAHTFVEFDGVERGDVAPSTDLTGVVTQVRTLSTSTGARVEINVDGTAYRRVFQLLDPFRVVVDIARQPPGRGADEKRRTVTRVVLDPGHGGSDPGAVGPSGLREKDATLAIAKRVAVTLAQFGIVVTLTRDEDRFVSLEERTARANANGADLFVSIHCNASDRAGRRGVESYVLDTSATEMAGKVAARENGASQAASNEVARLLAAMSLADHATRSVRLAELMQRASMASLHGKYDSVVDGGVHKAGFYVLVGARMPAVLFETSYISNPTEEERLGSVAYQQRLADAVVNAIKAYREGR
jgi:N-acetylmuramoyl-L-alanine amidase